MSCQPEGFQRGISYLSSRWIPQTAHELLLTMATPGTRSNSPRKKVCPMLAVRSLLLYGECVGIVVGTLVAVIEARTLTAVFRVGRASSARMLHRLDALSEDAVQLHTASLHMRLLGHARRIWTTPGSRRVFSGTLEIRKEMMIECACTLK